VKETNTAVKRNCSEGDTGTALRESSSDGDRGTETMKNT
jgi:hypothetical protein